MINILLVAPINASGGIARWTEVFTAHITKANVEILNTASLKLTLGETSIRRRAWFGTRAAVARILRLLWICTTRRPDVVYLTCSPSAGLWVRDFPMILLLHALRIPVVVHLHGGSEAGFFGAGRLRCAVAAFVYRRVDAVIAITRAIESRARTQLGSHYISYVPNMLDSSNLETRAQPTRPPFDDSRRLTVLHVGWQGKAKGTLEVLELAGRFREVDYVLVGPIPPDMQNEINQRMEYFNLAPFVRFTDELRGDALVSAYAKADIFLLPSHGEGFPMAILEALEHSLPVIATDVGAIPDILATNSPDCCGVVVHYGPPVDQGELERALRQLARSGDTRRRLGVNGRRRLLANYTPEAVVPILEEIVIRAAGRPSADCIQTVIH